MAGSAGALDGPATDAGDFDPPDTALADCDPEGVGLKGDGAGADAAIVPGSGFFILGQAA